MFRFGNSGQYLAQAFRAAALLAALGLALHLQEAGQTAYATEAAPKATSAPAPPPKGIAAPRGQRKQNEHGGSEPWNDFDIVRPAELAKTLSDPKSSKPLVVCVGFYALYRSAHIPAAEFHGAASTTAGLENLKARASHLPRNQPIVLYCGCCPWTHCPNIRPAFKVLREMGFKQLKLLAIPTDFDTDWVNKGYPVEKPPHP